MPKYKYIHNFYDGIALVVMKSKFEYINLKGEIISKDKDYACYHNFKKGFSRVKRHDLSGFIDTSGNYICEPKFVDENDFSEGRAAVKLEQKWGFIDSTGNYIVEPQFYNVRNFNEGLAAVCLDYKWGYIDLSGNIIVEPKYKSAGDFSCGRAIVSEGNTKKYINKTGEIIPNVDNYLISDDFIENFAVVRKGDYYGFIDTSGNYLIAPQFNVVKKFANGHAIVQSQKKCGYINAKGEMAVPMTYDLCLKCKDSMARVQLKSKLYFINLQSGQLIEQEKEYRVFFGFSEDLARVDYKGKWGYIDKNGKVVIDFIYDDAKDFRNGLAAVRIGDLWGFIDKEGTIVIKPSFNKIGYVNIAEE